MQSFTFYNDQLVQIWGRSYLHVEAETLEEAIEFLKKDKEHNFDNCFDEFELLFDTQEAVVDKEVYNEIIYADEDSDIIIYSNKEGWIE